MAGLALITGASSGPDELISTARTLAAEERQLRSRADTSAAEERFRADRLEAINPVIVDGFVERLAAAVGWQLSPGPVTGLRRIRSPRGIPPALGGGTEALVAADGDTRQRAFHKRWTGTRSPTGTKLPATCLVGCYISLNFPTEPHRRGSPQRLGTPNAGETERGRHGQAPGIGAPREGS